MLPASNLSRHDGLRSVPNNVVVVVFVDVATADDASVVILIGGDDGDIGDESFFFPIFSESWLLFGAISAYLLASFRNLSANDNEFALSISNNERLLMCLVFEIFILSFLSSSVTGNDASFVGSPAAAVIADVDFWLLSAVVVVLWKLKLVWTFVVGDVLFDNNTSESVFFIAIDGDDGTLIVTAAVNGGGWVCGNGGGGIVNDTALSSSNWFDDEFWILFDDGLIIVYDAVIWSDEFVLPLEIIVVVGVADDADVIVVVALVLPSSDAFNVIVVVVGVLSFYGGWQICFFFFF